MIPEHGGREVAMPQIVGVVLTGGRGRRMGGPKGEIELEGRSLAERAAATLWPHCASVLISIRPGAPNPAPQHPAIADDPPADRGPLAGIHAAFLASGSADLLVLACDYPAMSGDGLSAILDAARPEDDLVLAVDGSGRDHPLVGLWRRSALPHVERALSDRLYKVRALLPDLATRRVSPADAPGVDLDALLLNVNHPEDLLRL
jgi:molybdopterin-guanine dinucleotide biosynthesis protein A